MKHRPNILFVCNKNKWRSPTAEKIYSNDIRINVRSAGLNTGSKKTISEKDILWADLILVMEQKQKKRINSLFKHLEIRKIESLEIPDIYEFMDPELIEQLKLRSEFFINEIT